MLDNDIKTEELDYGERLGLRLKDLAITEKELAEAVGCNVKTIGRYIQNAYTPSQKISKRIESYLKRKSCYECYRHIPSGKFAEMTKRYLEHFKNEITQQELAEKVGMSGQSEISKIVNHKKNLTSEEQYTILLEFLKLCYKPGKSIFSSAKNIHLCDRKIADEIIRLIREPHNRDEFIEYYMAEYDIDEQPDTNIMDIAIEKIMDYSVEKQDMILENHLAFFDSAQIIYDDDGEFLSARDLVDSFRIFLSPKKKVRFIRGLEILAHKKQLFSYHNNTDHWVLFEMVTHYRNMIKNAYERCIKDPEIDPPDSFGEPMCVFTTRKRPSKIVGTENENDAYEQRVREFVNIFMDLLHFNEYEGNEIELWKTDPYVVSGVSAIINEIEFKMDMSPLEWYVWMLIAAYAFAYHEVETIEELMEIIVFTDYTPT